MNDEESIPNKANENAEPLQDTACPEDLSGSLKAIRKRKEKSPSNFWHLDLATELSDLVDRFASETWDDEEYQDSQFCRLFLWTIETNASQIRQALQHHQTNRVLLLAFVTLPYAMGIYPEDVNPDNKDIAWYTNAVTEVIAAYTGYHGSKTLEECIASLRAIIETARVKMEE